MSADQGSKTIWVHIGAPKTGSTSLQTFARDHADYVARNRTQFVMWKRRTALNVLAIALRNHRADQVAKLGAMVNRTIEESNARNLVISSEMLVRGAPTTLRDAIPCLKDLPLNIVYYIRRQDQYFESAYKQKIKNGKSTESLEEYLEYFLQLEAVFLPPVEAWSEAFPQARWHVRRLEPGVLYRDNVVDDFFHLLGAEDIPEELRAAGTSNVSPSVDTLEIMRQLALVSEGRVNMRLVQRSVARSGAAGAGPRGRLLSPEQAQRVMDRYAGENEALRARFFPDEAALFDVSDLQALSPVSTSFTPEQLALVQSVFRALREVHLDPGARGAGS